eukprot:256066-Rhodomonas_salina.2
MLLGREGGLEGREARLCGGHERRDEEKEERGEKTERREREERREGREGRKGGTGVGGGNGGLFLHALHQHALWLNSA